METTYEILIDERSRAERMQVSKLIVQELDSVAPSLEYAALEFHELTFERYSDERKKRTAKAVKNLINRNVLYIDKHSVLRLNENIN